MWILRLQAAWQEYLVVRELKRMLAEIRKMGEK